MDRDLNQEALKQEQKRMENRSLKDRFKAALLRKLNLNRPRPLRRRKAKLFSFFVLLSLWHKVQKNKLAKRERQVADMENGVKIYTEVARSFLMKQTKNILINVSIKNN